MPSLVSTWDLDGFVDEQRYYCSLTTMNPASMPAPKATLDGNVRTHTDTNVTKGQMYYVRIGSVRNEVEKISSEFKLIAQKILVDMPLLAGLSNYGISTVTATNNGGVLFNAVNGALLGGGNQYISINTTSVNFNSNYKIGFEITPTSFAQPGNGSVVLSNSTETWQATFCVSMVHDGNPYVIPRTLEFGIPDVYGQPSSKVLEANKTYSIILKRSGNVIYLYVDDVLVSQRTETNTIATTNILRLGVITYPTVGIYKGYIKNLKVYDVS